jgi:hypothetical protein
VEYEPRNENYEAANESRKFGGFGTSLVSREFFHSTTREGENIECKDPSFLDKTAQVHFVLLCL